MSVEVALVTLLKNATGVALLAGTRIFPMIAPANVAPPFVTYQRISGARDHALSGPTGFAQPRIQIDAFATTYLGAKALGAEIREALDGYRGTVGAVRIGGISLASDQDMYEGEVDPPLYRVSMDFMVTHGE